MSKHSMVCAGIDTGKRKLQVALNERPERREVDNTAAGHKRLADWLLQHRVKRVGIEASGGYEQALVAELRRRSFVVIVFQPAQVRAYAIFHLQRAKNDKIDAALIASCAAATKKIHAPPDPRLAPFAEHLTMIEQVIEDIAVLKNRFESCRDTRIRQAWKAEIARLKKLEKTELKSLVAAIREHRDLGERLDLIRMPEIGRVTREQAAALAGLAPYDDDSGALVGARHILGGRERLRRALYTAALAAAFYWNPQLITLYKRLIGAGKVHKVALIACARKLLIFANTVVARGTPWTGQPQAA
jgi:transposase